MANIDKLKSRMRTALLAYRALADDTSCGNALLQHISPDARRFAEQFDAALAELKRVDPDCPAGIEPLSADP